MIDVFRLAHLRVFQSYLYKIRKIITYNTIYHFKTIKKQNVMSTPIKGKIILTKSGTHFAIFQSRQRPVMQIRLLGDFVTLCRKNIVKHFLGSISSWSIYVILSSLPSSSSSLWDPVCDIKTSKILSEKDWLDLFGPFSGVSMDPSCW